METVHCQEAINAFTTSAEVDIIPVSSGLINKTYKLSDTNGSYILQQINDTVFPEPAKVQGNYEKIYDHLAQQAGSVVIPQPLPFRDSRTLFTDSSQHCWRVFSFIDRSETFHSVQDAAQAKIAATGFGRLTLALDDMPVSVMEETIPGFHDLALRYHQFHTSLYTAKKERLGHAEPITQALKDREHYVRIYEHITNSPGFKKRAMHHDAKLSNLLFDIDGKKLLAIVDLDTCMPGYFFSDLGDLVRSMACRVSEGSKELRDIHIEKDIYNAILEGYLQPMEPSLSTVEKKYIHYPGLLMIYMQALRFLTDYLNGDIYYQVDHPSQNLERAVNQLRLLEELEDFLTREYGMKV